MRRTLVVSRCIVHDDTTVEDQHRVQRCSAAASIFQSVRGCTRSAADHPRFLTIKNASVLNLACATTPSLARVQLRQMNELLNRWRHGEVNLLQRRFRLARAQTVKPTMASKFLGSLAPPPSNSGMGTSAAAAASASANRDIDGDDVSTSPASHDGVADADNKKQGDGAVTGAGGARLGAGSGDAEEAMPLGGVGVGGARAGMDREAFLRVFPDVKVREKERWWMGVSLRYCFCDPTRGNMCCSVLYINSILGRVAGVAARHG